MVNIMKDLGNLLRRTAIISSVVAVPLIFAGCEKNSPPDGSDLEVNPTSGDAPLEVRMKYTGKDNDGIEDIQQHTLHIEYTNNEVVKNKSPLDLTRVFTTPGTVKIYGEVIDSEGEIGRSPIIYVNVYQGPFLEQSVSLENDVNLKYSATLSKVPKAQLKVKREGVLISTEEISDVNPTGVDFEKTYGTAKGNYEFTLTSDNLEKKNSTEIPNYKPTGNFSSLETDLEQDSEINVTLPTPLDKNPEDNPVAFANAKSLDGKTQLTLNGYDLNIKALSNYTGAYQFELEYGSTTGGLEKSVLGGEITAHTWKYLCNPFVQPNDTTKLIVWNNFSTTSQRSSHFDDRLYNFDKTDELNIPGGACSDYVRAWIIAFNGYPIEGLENNNWHNIPAYDVTFDIYGRPSHAAGGVNVGDYVTNINDWRFIETQNDSTYTPNKLKELGVYDIVIRYTFVNKYDGLLDGIPMFKFILNSNNEWVDSGYRNPEVNLITKRK